MLEQRIGRIHRYGQRRIATIYNLMIKDSREAEIFKRLQEKIEVIRKQLGNMAEVLGVLDRISLDDLILRVLDKSVTYEDSDHHRLSFAQLHPRLYPRPGEAGNEFW